jgi:hypothetical protein
MCFASTKMLDFSLDSDRNMFKVCELGYTQLTSTDTSLFASEIVRSLLRQGEEQTRQGTLADLRL